MALLCVWYGATNVISFSFNFTYAPLKKRHKRTQCLEADLADKWSNLLLQLYVAICLNGSFHIISDASMPNHVRPCLRRSSYRSGRYCFSLLVSVIASGLNEKQWIFVLKTCTAFSSLSNTHTGGLVFASIDQVHPDLHDNAIILGCLSFFVAILFVIDLADPLARMTAHMTQTEASSIAHDTPDARAATLKKDVSTDTTEPTVFVVSKPEQLNSHHQHQHPPSQQHNHHHHDHPAAHEYREDSPLNRSAESIVERKVYPSAQVPVFAHVRAPEESRRIAGKEIQYLPRNDFRDRRNYRDAGPASYATNRPPTNHSNGHPVRHHSTGAYHDNDSFVEDIQPSRRSTYVPADKFDQEAMQMSSAPMSANNHYRTRPPPPAKPLNIIRTHFGSNHSSPTGSQHSAECRCSQRSTSTRKLDDSGRDEFDSSSPIRPGFVANAAKKWDDRARSKSQPIVGLNTMV